MNRILGNEAGFGVNIAMAMVLVVIAMSSMVSMISVVNDDNNSINWLRDRLQQELLLRSEVIRLNYVLERDLVLLPKRQVEIIGKDRVSTYMINHRKFNDNVSNGLGTVSEATKIETMCASKSSRRNVPSPTGKNSPVLSFMEKVSQRSSLAQYQYFTDKEISDLTNDPAHISAQVKFWGPDELDGRIHSNDYIYVQNAGGGNNGGWPTFRDLVTTAKEAVRYTGTSGGASLTPGEKRLIFKGGLIEHVPPIEYMPDAATIKEKGIKFPAGPDIYFCDITRTAITITSANINTAIDTFVVYSSYPDYAHQYSNGQNPLGRVVGDSLWTNRIAMRDTVWVPGGTVSVSNNSIYFPGEVWVKGTVQGRMTIGSQGDAHIAGNLLYENTRMGYRPDDFVNGINPSDFFGLVSERKIIIKYKYNHPDGRTGIVYSPMSTGPNGNIYLYGAFSAQGIEDPSLGPEWAYKAEGVFTYQYQHPHGGIPTHYRGTLYRLTSAMQQAGQQPVRMHVASDTLISYPAFHRFKFPPDNYSPSLPFWRRWPGASGQTPNNGYPNVNAPAPIWYSMYDYPYGYVDNHGLSYNENPVGPEPDYGPSFAPTNNNRRGLVYERGNLWIYGSIAQRRRGFIHRSGNQSPDNPDTNSYWNLPGYVFGGGHNSTGYNKKYYYDQRFLYVQPPHFPEVYQGSQAGRMSAFKEMAWNYRVPPRGWIY